MSRGRGTAESQPIGIRRAVAELLLCVFFWGASFASMKIAVQEAEPLVAVWFRFTFGLAVLLGFILARRQLRLPTAAEVPPLLFLGTMGVTFHQNLQFVAMRTAGVANANWLVAATPSVVALLGWIFLKEKLGRVAIGGLIVSGLGVLLVVGLGTRGLSMFRMGAFGDLLMFVSALNWAVFQIVSRKLLISRPPAFTAFWMNVFAFIQQTAILCVYPPNLGALADVGLRGWSAMCFLGFICSGLCYVFWYDGLSVLPAAKVTAFQFLQPVFGAVVAYFLIGERFTPFIFIGGTMILAGVWMVNRRELSRKRISES